MRQTNTYNYCKLLFLLSLFFLSLFTTTKRCQAIENKAPFMVQMLPSPFQVDQTQNYFDLNIPSNQAITLSVQIRNLVDFPINLSISANQATTNLNGIVEYGPATNKLSKEVPLKLSECVTVLQPKITLPAKSTIQTSVLVSIPNNQFAYTIALLIHGILPIQENK